MNTEERMEHQRAGLRLDTIQKIEQMNAKCRLDTINRVVKEWREQGGKFGANGIDWAIVEYLYDNLFDRNNLMTVVEVRDTTVVFTVQDETFRNSIRYSWNLFTGIHPA